MDTKFEIHKYYDIHIDDEDLAIAFSEAKQSYGPRPEDMSIEDYVFDLMNESAMDFLKVYINDTELADDFRDIEMYYEDAVYDFVYNYIEDELEKAQKRIESGEVVYI